MFSDSGAPAPGEQKSFKHHTPHFIPWLRNSLKPHHGSDLGLNGPYKSGLEAPSHLTPLERAKGIGLFSIQGKEKKKRELRLNGVGMARILPVVLRGHHILPGGMGKQREDRTSKCSQPPELPSDPVAGDLQPGRSDNSTSAPEHNSSLLQAQNQGTSTSTYGPHGGAPPAASPQDPERKATDVEDPKVKVWDYASSTNYCQKELHSSSWVGSDRRGLTERSLTSSFGHIQQKSRKSQSQRDLREPPVEGLSRPLNGVVLSTGVSERGFDCTATLRGPRKPRTNWEYAGILGLNQTRVQSRPTADRALQVKEVGCSRKVVRSQIKRVVDNLEKVLRALRDVQQEMREVVQQIDFLTSSIDVSDDEQQSAAGGDDADSSPSGSSSSEVTVGGFRQRPSELRDKPCAAGLSGRRDHHCRSVSPPNTLLSAVASGFSSDRVLSLRFPSKVAPLRPSGSLRPSSPPRLEADVDFNPSPQKSLPVRPPTPGLSPLTVNLHHPNSPSSRPHSPGPSTSIRVSPSSPPSPKIKPPPTLCPSVIIENKIRHYQNLQSDHPSVGQPSSPWLQPPSACCPPTNMETQVRAGDHRDDPPSSAHRVNGLLQARTGPVSAKPSAAQGARGRKPPPYPHHRLSEQEKKEEPRKAPPYPEKRRLLSTTV